MVFFGFTLLSLKLGVTAKTGFHILREHRKIHQFREKKYFLKCISLIFMQYCRIWICELIFFLYK